MSVRRPTDGGIREGGTKRGGQDSGEPQSRADAGDASVDQSAPSEGGVRDASRPPRVDAADTGSSATNEGGIERFPTHKIAVGDGYVCALHQPDGKPYCFGIDDEGQLGDGRFSAVDDPPTTTWSPVLSYSGGDAGVPISTARSISAGVDHTCLLEENSVACWGDGIAGQTGGAYKTTPFARTALFFEGPDTGPSAISDLVTGDADDCVRTSSGVYCWGDNEYNQVTGKSTLTVLPVSPIPELEKARVLALGGEFSLALLDDGSVECWGRNEERECGFVSRDRCPAYPQDDVEVCVLTPSLVDVPASRAISTGTAHACAVGADGAVRCWGGNTDGQVGSTPASDCSAFGVAACAVDITVVPNIADPKAISVNGDHSCAIVDGAPPDAADGEVLCWGRLGALGRDEDLKAAAPVPGFVIDESGAHLSGIVEIVAGPTDTCARNAAGDVFCWGSWPHATRIPWPD